MPCCLVPFGILCIPKLGSRFFLSFKTARASARVTFFIIKPHSEPDPFGAADNVPERLPVSLALEVKVVVNVGDDPAVAQSVQPVERRVNYSSRFSLLSSRLKPKLCISFSSLPFISCGIG